MNRPTIDVDDLLEIADEAITSGDQAEAVAILRKAAAIAPLRRDIRNRLALVLEGTPVSVKAVKPAKPINSRATTLDEPIEFFDAQYGATDSAPGLESISQIARKAFDAAALQKSKAGDATRKLTNLLQTGLGSWKSTIASTTNRSSMATPQVEEAPVESRTQSIVFRPEEELKHYLERSEPGAEGPVDNDDNDSDDELIKTKISKPGPVSRKAGRTPGASKTSAKRPTDVEDVLAAGIGGFIEAAGRMDKRKIVYALVYTGMVFLFGFACFDVSRKFPGLSSSNGNVQSASLDFPAGISKRLTSAEALDRSKELVSEGKTDEAIALLNEQLAGGQLLHKRDLFRVELASLLNIRAEEQLKANQLAAAVDTYRQALSHLPGDTRLQLRLANALYYFGVMGTADSSGKEKALQDASGLLGAIIKADSTDIQAHRLQALIYDARNEKNQARSSWQKVKELAPANSSILAEAKSHLK